MIPIPHSDTRIPGSEGGIGFIAAGSPSRKSGTATLASPLNYAVHRLTVGDNR